jgi:dGTPase
VDEVAYNHHDIDDGIASGLLQLDELAAAVPLFGAPLAEARRTLPRATPRQISSTALRGLIDTLVTDLIETTRANVERAGVGTTADVRRAGRPLVGLSAETARASRVLKGHLRRHLYQHPRIERMKDKAARILLALFERYRANPRLLPDEASRRDGEDSLERTIADYVAGMTDRYAIQEYQRLFDPAVRV